MSRYRQTDTSPDKETTLSLEPRPSHTLIGRIAKLMLRRLAYIFGTFALVFIVLMLGVRYFSDSLKDIGLIDQQVIQGEGDYTTFIRPLRKVILCERASSGEVRDRLRTDINLGISTIRSEADVKVTYQSVCYYGIEADSKYWDFRVVGQTLYVCAPELKPLRVNVIYDSVQHSIDGGYLVFNEEEYMQNILKTLPDRAQKQAESLGALRAVRESCRVELGNVIMNYIPQSARIRSVLIRFPDEPDFPPESPLGLDSDV